MGDDLVAAGFDLEGDHLAGAQVLRLGRGERFDDDLRTGRDRRVHRPGDHGERHPAHGQRQRDGGDEDA